MTSQVSTRKLLRQEMRRHSWILGQTALLHLLTGPVVFLLYTASYDTWTTTNSLNRIHNFFRHTYLPWQLFTMIVCITMCIAIYRYLFDHRMVDLYHSVPLRRGQLFLVKYLHGLLVWLLPFLASFILVALLCTIRLFGRVGMLAVAQPMLKCFFLILVCYFIFYHLFLVAVYLSGNVINMFTNVAIIGLCVLGLWYLFFGFAAYFFDTYCYTPPAYMTDIVFSLSPFAAPFGIYSYFTGGSLFSEHWLLLCLSIPLSALTLVLARYLYQIRPSELAERGTLFKSYTIPAHILTTIVLGTAGSLFFSNIVGETGQLAWGIFGAILCSILSAGFINSIFHASIKAFFKHKIQLVLGTALSTFFVLSIQLDLFGYDTYLPDKEDIAGIAIYTHALSDHSSTYMRMENGSLAQADNTDRYVMQEDLFTDKDLCYDLLSTFIYSDTETATGNNTYFYTKIVLENGRTYTRYYKLRDSLYAKIAPFIEDDTYKETNYKFSTGAFRYPAKLDFSLWDYSISGKLDQATIQRIMDAYWLDFEEHYTLEELSSYLYVGELSGTYNYIDGVNTRQFSLRVHDNYTRTLAVLQELMPEYLPAVKGMEDIQKVYLHASGTEADINALYEHFGYDAATGISNTESATIWETQSTSSYNPGSPGAQEVVYIEDAQYITAVPMELTLTDAESIGELYPFLYYGNYIDLFGKDEYIAVGHITTTRGYTVGIYVKPGTLPQKYIEQLYEARQESTNELYELY